MMIVLARSTSRRGSCRRQKKAPSDSLQQHQRHMRSRSHAMQLSSVWRALDGMQTRCRNLQARQGRLLRPLLTCAAAWTRQRQPRVACGSSQGLQSSQMEANAGAPQLQLWEVQRRAEMSQACLTTQASTLAAGVSSTRKMTLSASEARASL